MLKKVYLEITNVCNLACAFCPGTRREERFMSPAEFTCLAEKICPHTDFLYFHLMGEPLLHPELETLFGIAGALGFRVIITTNGTLLEQAGEVLLRSPALHKVNISLQSFEGNGADAPGDYVRSCARFAERAAEAGKLCVLRLWNREGLDSLNGEIEAVLTACFPRPWPESRGSLRLRERVWLQHGDKFGWPDLNAAERAGGRFCYGLRDQIGILCDGTVVPCCLDHEGEIPLGNLFESSLEKIMSSERARAIYEGFSRRRAAEELCRKCGYAERFTSLN